MPLFQRGGIERPPAEYRSGDTQTGATQVREFDDRDGVIDYCLANGAMPATSYSGSRKVRACYDVGNDVVAIIRRGKIPDYEWQEELDHELGHARGWRHNPDGRGTSPNSLPPRALSRAESSPQPARNALTRSAR